MTVLTVARETEQLQVHVAERVPGGADSGPCRDTARPARSLRRR